MTALARWAVMLALLAGVCPAAHAFVVTISPGARAVYLRVGDGVFSGNYSNGGPPGSGGGSDGGPVTVPAAALGNGVDQAMTTNSATGVSNWDGYAFCNTPAEVYIGGFCRQPGQNGSATLTATAPATLVS